MQENKYDVTIEYRKPIKGNGHMLKVHFRGLGMYIDGWTIRPSASAQNPSGWWFQPPARPYNGRYKQIVEFNKKSEFWLWLEEAAVSLLQSRIESAHDAEAISSDDAVSDDSWLNDVKKRLDEFENDKG